MFKKANRCSFRGQLGASCPFCALHLRWLHSHEKVDSRTPASSLPILLQDFAAHVEHGSRSNALRISKVRTHRGMLWSGARPIEGFDLQLRIRCSPHIYEYCVGQYRMGSPFKNLREGRREPNIKYSVGWARRALIIRLLEPVLACGVQPAPPLGVLMQ